MERAPDKRFLPPLALPEDLAALQRKEFNGVELPLVLKRFREHIGSPNVIDAIQIATSRLLADYVDEKPDAKIINTQRLCELCGIDLYGRPRRPNSKNPPVYSTLRPEETQSGHTASLKLSSEGSTIHLPPGVDYEKARLGIAHELGHYLIHSRGDHSIDTFTARLPSSEDEEAISEYAARLLLFPHPYRNVDMGKKNLADAYLEAAGRFKITAHSAAARLGDPDSPLAGNVLSVILWRLNPKVSEHAPLASRLTPYWRLSSGKFIPIKSCHAGRDSLVAEVGALNTRSDAGSRIESVSIGALTGTYRVDVVARGYIESGTRVVWSVFSKP